MWYLIVSFSVLCHLSYFDIMARKFFHSVHRIHIYYGSIQVVVVVFYTRPNKTEKMHFKCASGVCNGMFLVFLIVLTLIEFVKKTRHFIE